MICIDCTTSVFTSSSFTLSDSSVFPSSTVISIGTKQTSFFSLLNRKKTFSSTLSWRTGLVSGAPWEMRLGITLSATLVSLTISSLNPILTAPSQVNPCCSCLYTHLACIFGKALLSLVSAILITYPLLIFFPNEELMRVKSWKNSAERQVCLEDKLPP